MKIIQLVSGIFIAFFFSRCGAFRNTVSDSFPEGTYRSKISDSKKVYVQYQGDTLAVYKLQRVKGADVADTLKSSVMIFYPKMDQIRMVHTFNNTSLDFDALAIPFKYRFSSRTLPPQFTTSLNGAVYLGFRNDRYKLLYKKHFFNYYQRYVYHSAVSFGGFTGFGSTAMNPWVTENNISSEYEGVVWLNGVALIVALGNFTTGVSIGWDHLLDQNQKFWIYQGKPWLGLVFGLNLN